MKKYNISKDFLIQEYIKKEKPAQTIAEIFGCECGTIYRKLKTYNIPRRNSGSKYNPEKHKKYFCIDCGKEINWQTWCYGAKRCNSCSQKERFKNKENHPLYNKHHTEETRKKISLVKGGTGIPYEFNEYPEEFYKIRIKILKRDNYICQKCFEYGNEVHHIDYNKQNNNESNLICLCHKCNMKVNFNRDYWKSYFSSITSALISV